MDLVNAESVIRTLLKAGRNIGLVGQPGVGKTETIRRICESLTAADIFAHKAQPGDEKRSVRFIPIATTTKEAVDVAGLPNEHDGRTRWAPPGWIPENDEPAVVFLDEFPQAEIPTQLGFQKLIDRDLDGIEVSSRCVFIVAGNRPEDNSAAGDIPQHIRNRFSWLSIETDSESWCEWAWEQGLHQSITGFVKFSPVNLNTFSPNSQAYAYATPRSVAECARIISDAPEEQWHAIASATCGETWAAEWGQYRQYEEKCPNIESALKNPDAFEFPKEFGIVFAFVDAVSHTVSKNDSDELINARLRIIERLMEETEHQELAGKTLRSCSARNDRYTKIDSEVQKRVFDKLYSFLAA